MPQTAKKPPDTLPANFQSWDSAPATLPADFNSWDSAKSRVKPQAPQPGLIDFLKQSIPSGSQFARSLGIPTSSAEALAMAQEQAAHPVKAILNSPAVGIAYGQPIISMLAGMGKEAYRGAKGTLQGDTLAPLHTAAALNPFAAPVVSQMSEQGLGTPEANATGITNVVPMAAGEIGSKLPVPANASALAELAGREVTGKIPFLGRFEAFKTPTFGEYKQALTPNPQLALFKKTPKLGEYPSTVKTIAGTSQEAADPLAAAVKQNEAATQAVQPSPQPASMEGYYGKTKPRNLVPAHKRQMASPTFSTAPGQPPAVETVPEQPEVQPFSLGSMKQYNTIQQIAGTGAKASQGAAAPLPPRLAQGFEAIREADARVAAQPNTYVRSVTQRPGYGTAEIPVEERVTPNEPTPKPKAKVRHRQAGR